MVHFVYFKAGSKLTGSIPSEIFALTELDELDLCKFIVYQIGKFELFSIL